MELDPINSGSDYVTKDKVFAEGTYSFDTNDDKLQLNISSKTPLYENVSSSGSKYLYTSTKDSEMDDTMSVGYSAQDNTISFQDVKLVLAEFEQTKDAVSKLPTAAGTQKMYTKQANKTVAQVLPSVDDFVEII